MTSPPFAIFPWQRPFLPDLKKYVEQTAGSDPGRSIIIVPNNRPWRYFTDLYIQDKKPAFIPRMIPFAELVKIWNQPAIPMNYRSAGWLDQAALLRQCVVEAARENDDLSRRFADMPMSLFLPWGFRLARLFEEMFSQGIEARDISHAEDNVLPAAGALLSALGAINAKWRQLLAQNNWLTPGYENYLAALNAAHIPQLLKPGADRHVFIAGFSDLTGAQEQIFKSLWTAGAHVCLHTDPGLAQDEKPHWSCGAHAEWLRRWKAKTALAPGCPEYEDKKQTIKFFAAYDCHSQLEELRKHLLAAKDSQNSAIILPSPDSLMPALFHLPDKNVNISLGYPLKRGAIIALLQASFNLHARKRSSGFYWQDVLSVISHPFLHMLKFQTASGQLETGRAYFRELEKNVRAGAKYISSEQLHGLALGLDDGCAGQFLQECLRLFIDLPAQAETTFQAGVLLEEICDFLLAHGESLWSSFPMDAEALWRVQERLIPELKDNQLKDEKFSQETLAGIFEQLVNEERIPFEADPLVGLQLLGLLETRLLHFDKIYVLDATDDILPGKPSQDPLLPDSLRALAGLPEARIRERISAYNLFRLCKSASEVNFYWDEGETRTALFDSKKTRSRFVEQLIWEQELKSGQILKPGTGNLHAAAIGAKTFVKNGQTIPQTAIIQEKLDKFLQARLSPTALDSYLHCPFNFACHYLLGLAPPVAVSEAEDYALVGTFIHEVMKGIYLPYLKQDKPVHRDDIAFPMIAEIIKRTSKDMRLQELMSPASFLMLETSTPILLKRYLEKQPDQTRVRMIERDISGNITLKKDRFTLGGRIDRLDERDGALAVLDYKTGSAPQYDSSLWRDQEFFAALREYSGNPHSFQDADGSLLASFRDKAGSVQLPIYVVIMSKSGLGDVRSAAFVDLHESGEEKDLFKGLEEEQRPEAVANCETLVKFLIAHLKSASSFAPVKSGACQWCVYKSLCNG